MIYQRLPFLLLLPLVALSAPRDVVAAPTFGGSSDARELANGTMTRDGRSSVLGRSGVLRDAAWKRLEAETGPAWASWDPATRIPSRILLGGIEAPDTIDSEAAAEAFATDFLARHLDLLAPGSDLTDFVLVANDLSSGIRSVGFVQKHVGMTVLGGQLSFRFKFDRLVMIGSEAFPDVSVPTRGHTVSSATASSRAKAWVEDGRAVKARTSDPLSGPFILPVVSGSSISYREVFATELDVDGAAEHWEVFLDADSGAPVARRQTLMFGTSTLLYNVPDRHPLGPRSNLPAGNADILTSQGITQSATNGTFDFPGVSDNIMPSVAGSLVAVSTATGTLPNATLTAADGVTTVWDESSNEFDDAALTAFAHTGLVKEFVRTIAPELAWLNTTIPVTVNIDDSCNAFSDGNSINFFAASPECQNTGLLADVVYHEFGHSVHSQSLVPGVGQFNVALSEGISDYLSATITEDSGLGRGFFYNEQPLRDFDPAGLEYRWPEDRGEVHAEGRIIGGALWDLRKLIIADLGEVPGRNYTNLLWYETTRRAVDIPSMYPEALLFDDDDGNLTNGTPRGCLINDAYGPHGLFDPGPENESVELTRGDDGNHIVALEMSLPNFPDCPISANAELAWKFRDQPSEEVVVPFSDLDGALVASVGTLPPGSVLQYQVRVSYTNGAERSLPDNIVDPWYEYFVGDVIPLQCVSDGVWGFDVEGNGGELWTVAPLAGDDHSTDPSAPFDAGIHVFQPGPYPRFADTRIRFDSVNTQGYDNVRLQYYRWLTVEDGFFDGAAILGDETVLWENFASVDDSAASFHHVDREWRFHDVDLSAQAADGSVSVAFRQRSDGGLEFGGWAIAAMCVVAFDPDQQLCGNGILDEGELCDDANNIDGDGCSSVCVPEDGPSTTTSTTEGETDSDSVGDSDGPEETGGSEDTEGDTDTDSDTDGFAEFDGDGLLDRGCACMASPGGDNDGWLAVVALFGLGLLGRRRRSA